MSRSLFLLGGILGQTVDSGRVQDRVKRVVVIVIIKRVGISIILLLGLCWGYLGCWGFFLLASNGGRVQDGLQRVNIIVLSKTITIV